MSLENVTDSILYSVKKCSGLNEAFQDDFDVDLIIFINGVLNTLTQIGVGDSTGFAITGMTESWSDFLGNSTLLNLVKPYVYLKTRMQFDPPTTGAVKEAFEKQIAEYEWRINVMVDPGRSTVWTL